MNNNLAPSKKGHRIYFLAALLLLALPVGFYLLKTYRASQVSLAEIQLQQGQLEESEKRLQQASFCFHDAKTRHRILLLTARIEIQKRDQKTESKPQQPDKLWFEEMGQQLQRTAASIELLKTVPKESDHYAEAALILARESFYHSHRFAEAEQHLQTGLAIDPNHVELQILRLKLFTASGRWLEAIENVPLSALRAATGAERKKLVSEFCLAAFFPEEFNLAVDRELGILGAQELANPNTQVDRFEFLTAKDPSWSPPFAALSQWYSDRGLIVVSKEKLAAGQSAFKSNPSAIYLQQLINISVHANKTSPQEDPNRIKQTQVLKSLASDARWNHASVTLFGKAGQADLTDWPSNADQRLLTFLTENGSVQDSSANQQIGNISEASSARQTLNKWKIKNRQQLMQAIEDPSSHQVFLADCWRDFGQFELVELLLQTHFFEVR